MSEDYSVVWSVSEIITAFNALWSDFERRALSAKQRERYTASYNVTLTDEERQAAFDRAQTVVVEAMTLAKVMPR